MDAKPPRTHRKAFLATRIPSRVCFPLSFALGGLGSLSALTSLLLLLTGPEKYFPTETDFSALRAGLLDTIYSGLGLMVLGLYFFVCGIVLVAISEHLQIKDKEKGYDYSGL